MRWNTSPFIRQMREYIAQKTVAHLRFVDLADALNDNDLQAFARTVTPAQVEFYRAHLIAFLNEMAEHPVGPPIERSIAEALDLRDYPPRDLLRRAATLFDNDAEMIERVAVAVEGLRLDMVFADMFDPLDAVLLASPWRTALGDKYDIGGLGIVVDMHIGHWRATGSACPIDAARIDINKCGECDFFRGAATTRSPDSGAPGEFEMNCNWPRNGATIAAPSPSLNAREERSPLPAYLRNAFANNRLAAPETDRPFIEPDD